MPGEIIMMNRTIARKISILKCAPSQRFSWISALASAVLAVTFLSSQAVVAQDERLLEKLPQNSGARFQDIFDVLTESDKPSTESQCDACSFSLFSGSYGRSNFDYGSILGQGVTVLTNAPEIRTAGSPAEIDLDLYELGWENEKYFAKLGLAQGDGTASTASPAARNGLLFLGQDDRGINGSTFTNFAADETVTVEVDRAYLEFGTRFDWESISPRVSMLKPDVSVYIETTDIEAHSQWVLTGFPGTGADTTHKLGWDVLGARIAQPIGNWVIGNGLLARLILSAELGLADVSYDATQVVSNDPAPKRSFSATDSRTTLVGGFGVEAGITKALNKQFAADIAAGVLLRAVPTIDQKSGAELETGMQNSITTDDATEFWLHLKIIAFP